MNNALCSLNIRHFKLSKWHKMPRNLLLTIYSYYQEYTYVCTLVIIIILPYSQKIICYQCAKILNGWLNTWISVIYTSVI